MAAMNLDRKGSAVLGIALLALVPFLGCEKWGSGEAGQAFRLQGDYVIINHGYSRDGGVRYVVVRDWPETSTPDERVSDRRSMLDPQATTVVRLSDGRYVPAEEGEPRLFFYAGDELTTFPIQMKEDDFIGLKTASLESYGELLSFFRRFEVKGSP